MRVTKILLVLALAGTATAALALSPPPVGNARNGLTTIKGLNVLVLKHMNVAGAETEGKVYVGGNLTGGNSTQIGFGNSQQGEAVSWRATLTVGGALSANINLSNGSNGGSGNLGSYGATVVGNAQGFDLHNTNAVVNVGGTLTALGLSNGSTVNVVGSIVNNIDFRDNNFVNVGGNVATAQGGNNVHLNVTGNVATLQTGGGVARIGGSLGNVNVSNMTLDVVGSIGGGNFGSNDLVKVGGNVSNVNATNGTTVYAHGTITGNANGGSFNQSYAFSGGNPAPTAPAAPVVSSVDVETAQIQADVRALSSALGGLTIASNPSTLVWSGGFQTATFNAVDNGAGFAVFNVDESIFNAQQIAYNLGSTTLPVIINIRNSNAAIHAAHSGVYTLAANFLGNARANNQQVIWNFTDAATLDLQRQFQGSVLAPEASLTANVIEGSVVARMFNQTNEVHLGTYARSVTFIPDYVGHVPEPAVWLEMLLGFGIAGLAFRSQKLEELA